MGRRTDLRTPGVRETIAKALDKHPTAKIVFWRSEKAERVSHGAKHMTHGARWKIYRVDPVDLTLTGVNNPSGGTNVWSYLREAERFLGVGEVMEISKDLSLGWTR